MTQEVVEEEVVQLVWSHEVLGLLLYVSILVCRQQLRAYRSIDDVTKYVGRGIVGDLGKVLYQISDEGFRNTRVYGVHAHVVAIVGGPAKCKL